MRTNSLLCLCALIQNIDLRGQGMKPLSQFTGLSLSQCFESLEDLYERKLVSGNRKNLDSEKIEIFFTSALPFLFPAKMQGSGNGLSTGYSSLATFGGPTVSGGDVLVWTTAKGRVTRGMQVEPLHEKIFDIISKNPSQQAFFGAIEVLRFHDHPAKEKAKEKVLSYLEVPGSILPAEAREVTVERCIQIISEIGFINADINRLAKSLSLTPAHVLEKIGSLENLYVEVGKSAASRAYSHLGMVLMHSEGQSVSDIQTSLSSFLDFLDQNEDYFRLGLWFYLERIFEKSGGSGLLSDHFFDRLEKIFEQIPSSRSSRCRAVIFANSWVFYAWFRWVEFPAMKDKVAARSRADEIKAIILSLVA
jgi:hypothetical protein